MCGPKALRRVSACAAVVVALGVALFLVIWDIALPDVALSDAGASETLAFFESTGNQSAAARRPPAAALLLQLPSATALPSGIQRSSYSASSAPVRAPRQPPPHCSARPPPPGALANVPAALHPARRFGVVFADPRPNPALLWVINNTLAKLPKTWPAAVFFSPANVGFLETALAHLLQACRVTLLPFPPGDTSSYHFADDVMTAPAFYEALPFEKFLLLHSDAMLCRRDWSSETGLSRFVDWDFVGAPWGDGHVGNGGLSWRSRDAHLRVLKRFPRPTKEHEDGFFSKHMRAVGARTAPADEARLFSVEQPPLPPRNAKPWGVHKPWAGGGSAAFLRTLENMCPGLSELADLNAGFALVSSSTQAPSPTPRPAASAGGRDRGEASAEARLRPPGLKMWGPSAGKHGRGRP